jgi:hypothetical protein
MCQNPRPLAPVRRRAGPAALVSRRLHGFRHPQEFLIPRITLEGFDKVAAEGLHHRAVVVHDEVHRDVRLVALAETAIDQIGNPEEFGRRSELVTAPRYHEASVRSRGGEAPWIS